MVLDHLKHEGIAPDAPMCLAGGLWKSGRAFEVALAEAWTERSGTTPDFVRIEQPPVFGAVLLAKAMTD